MEAETPPLHDYHIERPIDNGGFFDSVALSRVETLVEDWDGNGASGIGFVDSEERVQDVGTEGNVVGPRLAPALKEDIVRMVVRNTDQP